ncbi:serine hydrolase [Thalassotalea sp. SU-HH00458]|uniref:serine hydrolase domain-containing protein n=1 Tax=Thalassotalea sp. SU-HH00458 TaxID=3127657 RepID=UPI0031082B26
MFNTPMSKQRLTFSTLLLFLGLVSVSGCGGGSSKSTNVGNNIDNAPVLQVPATGEAGDGRLTEIIEYLRIESNLPALAGVLIYDGEIIELGVSGRRAITSDNEVTIEDKWHVGSLTKSMTSTLAAKLVQENIIQWHTTIAEVYPELSDSMQSQYLSVKLSELLSHTAGFEENLPSLANYYQDNDEITIQRQKMVEEALMLQPNNARGEFHYSNLSYMVAGAMMEKLTGQSWELLINNYVFQPLNMTNTGFGAPDIEGDFQQPVGHSQSGNSWQAVMVSDSEIADNPPVIGPAGTVHASLTDMARYLSAHLTGARGESVHGFLSAEMFAVLHQDTSGTGYSLGWGINDGVLIHSGSNTMWLAKAVIRPQNNTAIFVVTNAADLVSSDSKAVIATDKLIEEIRKRASLVYGD